MHWAAANGEKPHEVTLGNSAAVWPAGTRVLEVAFGRNSKVHALRVPLPPRPAGAVGKAAPDSVRLRFDRTGVAANLAANTAGDGLACQPLRPAQDASASAAKRAAAKEGGDAEGGEGSAGAPDQKRQKV